MNRNGAGFAAYSQDGMFRLAIAAHHIFLASRLCATEPPAPQRQPLRLEIQTATMPRPRPAGSTLLLSPAGNKPLRHWYTKGRVRRAFDSSCKGFSVQLEAGSGSSIEWPRRGAEKPHGMLSYKVWPYVIFCARLVPGSPCSLCVHVKTGRFGARRRIDLTTALKKSRVTSTVST